MLKTWLEHLMIGRLRLPSPTHLCRSWGSHVPKGKGQEATTEKYSFMSSFCSMSIMIYECEMMFASDLLFTLVISPLDEIRIY